MLLALLLGISCGWLIWKLQDKSKEKSVRKVEEEKVFLSQNKRLEDQINSKLGRLEKDTQVYEKKFQINQTLHENYLNHYEIFKEETIKQYLIKKEKEHKAWAEREERNKAKKAEYAKKNLSKGLKND